MNFEMKITFEQMFTSLYMIDSLIIFKLIEEYTNSKLPDQKKFYNYVNNLEYVSYDDFYWPLDSFLYHTEIGEIVYDGEEFKLTLYSVCAAFLKKTNLEPDLQVELNTLINEVGEKITNVEDGICFSVHCYFNENKQIFEGFLSFDREGAICWHSICKILLDTHIECQKYL